MTNKGTNHTHRPRHGTHDLVPSGRLRCVAGDGRTCGKNHIKPEAAQEHCDALDIPDSQAVWKVEPTYLIPQYSTSDLKRRGWTLTTIPRILGHPDANEMGEDQHEGMTPRNFYDSYRVHDAEIRPPFQLAVEKNAHRPRHKTQPGQESPTVTAARTEPIVINPSATLKELNRAAILTVTRSEAQRWAMKLHESPDKPGREAREAAQRLIKSIVDDEDGPESVRHWEADYLHDLCSNIVDEGRHTHRQKVISARVYRALADMYPHLADICLERARQAWDCERDSAERRAQLDLFEQAQPPVEYNLTNLRWTKPGPKPKGRRKKAAAN